MFDEQYLLSELDLSEYGLGIIVPLTVKEVINLDKYKISDEFTRFDEFLIPFIADSKVFNISKIFNVLNFEDEKTQAFLALLIKSLQILYRSEEFPTVPDESNNINIVISNLTININNINILKEVICKMFFRVVQEDTNRVIQVADENRAILEEYLRLEQQYREETVERDKKNRKSLHQIVSIVASQCLWDYDKVLNMTYYRLLNTYMSIFKINEHKTYMQYVASGKYEMKNNSQKHWLETVGINK